MFSKLMGKSKARSGSTSSTGSNADGTPSRRPTVTRSSTSLFRLGDKDKEKEKKPNGNANETPRSSMMIVSSSVATEPSTVAPEKDEVLVQEPEEMKEDKAPANLPETRLVEEPKQVPAPPTELESEKDQVQPPESITQGHSSDTDWTPVDMTHSPSSAPADMNEQAPVVPETIIQPPQQPPLPIPDVLPAQTLPHTTPRENEIVELRSQLEANIKAQSDLQGHLSTLQGQLQVTQLEAQSHLSTISQLEKAVEAKEGTITQLQGDLESALAKVVDEQEIVSQKEIIIAAVEKQRDELRRDAEEEQKEMLAEVRRLDDIISSERAAHRAQIEGLERERDGLKGELEVQGEQIHILEGKLVESEGMLGQLRGELKEVHQQTRFQEDELKARRERTVDSESEIASLVMNNNNLSAQLIKLQERLDGSERQNRMLMEHIHIQSEELQSGKEVHRLWRNPLLPTTNPAASASTTTVTQSSTPANGNPESRKYSLHDRRIDEAVKLTKSLNEEIYQLSASLADHVESIEKRFVEQDSLSAVSAAASLKTLLGSDLVDALKREAPKDPSHEELNPFMIQIALQGCLIGCCMHTITSWYPAEWEYGGLLSALYERIRGLGWENANIWRLFTLQSVKPSPKSTALEDRIFTHLKSHILLVLRVAGWDKPLDIDGLVLAPFEDKILNIAALALKLNELRAEAAGQDVKGILEARIVKPGDKFWALTMCDDNEYNDAGESSHESSDQVIDLGEGTSESQGLLAPASPAAATTNYGKRFGEKVICTVALGLDYARETPPTSRLAGRVAGPTQIHEMLLKPRVLLHNSIF